MDKCTSWRGHKFEPRYDLGPATMEGSVKGCSADGFAKLLEKARKVTYICDVCVRCGQTVERVRHD